MSAFDIWTDGACLGNPGNGGWGVVLREKTTPAPKDIYLKGFVPQTTNNRMELQAAIEGLLAIPENATITIHTDSDYVKKGITLWIHRWLDNGWRTANKKPVKNIDLWQKLWDVQKNRKIEWKWVKAHIGIAENEKADQLAYQAANRER